MNKKRRQTILKKIILENNIQNQHDLMKHLKKSGIETTQSTISRDIKELNIVKGHTDSDHSYYHILNTSVRMKSLTEEARLINIIAESGLSLIQVEFINLLTVLPGNGQIVGVLIDSVRENFTEIAGCIAGDDTILIISKNKKDALVVNKYFQQYLYLH